MIVEVTTGASLVDADVTAGTPPNEVAVLVDVRVSVMVESVASEESDDAAAVAVSAAVTVRVDVELLSSPDSCLRRFALYCVLLIWYPTL